MTPVIDETRLRELERFYKSNRDRCRHRCEMWHFNDGRMAAVADLRRELRDNVPEAEFTERLSPKSSRC